MQLEEKLNALAGLKSFLKERPAELTQVIEQASLANKWFTTDSVELSLKHIVESYLNREKLEVWLSNYALKNKNQDKRLGIVMAGNIPLVGFHDFLCGFLSGYQLYLKLSSKDNLLLPLLIKKLTEQLPAATEQIHFTEKLKQVDAIIATGDDNTHRYFEYYFRNYKRLLRKNRNAVALLNGDETDEQLQLLSKDVFTYFGLGCRNVSSLLIPENFDLTRLLSAWEPYGEMMEHQGYKNNYDYHTSILLLSKKPHLTSGFLTIYEHEALASPMSCLHYQQWTDLSELKNIITERKNDIQCLVSESFRVEDVNTVRYGETQFPALDDYADNVDTMKFLLEEK